MNTSDEEQFSRQDDDFARPLGPEQDDDSARPLGTELENIQPDQGVGDEYYDDSAKDIDFENDEFSQDGFNDAYDRSWRNSATVVNRESFIRQGGKKWLLIGIGTVFMSMIITYMLTMLLLPYTVFIPAGIILGLSSIIYTSRRYLGSINNPSSRDALVYSIFIALAAAVPFVVFAFLRPCTGATCIGNGLSLIASFASVPVVSVVAYVISIANLKKRYSVDQDSHSSDSLVLKDEPSRPQKDVKFNAHLFKIIEIVVLIYAANSLYILDLGVFSLIIKALVIITMVTLLVFVVRNKTNQTESMKLAAMTCLPIVLDIIWLIFMAPLRDLLILQNFMPNGLLSMLIRALAAAVIIGMLSAYYRREPKNKISAPSTKKAIIFIAIDIIALITLGVLTCLEWFVWPVL